MVRWGGWLVGEGAVERRCWRRWCSGYCRKLWVEVYSQNNRVGQEGGVRDKPCPQSQLSLVMFTGIY